MTPLCQIVKLKARHTDAVCGQAFGDHGEKRTVNRLARTMGQQQVGPGPVRFVDQKSAIPSGRHQLVGSGKYFR